MRRFGGGSEEKPGIDGSHGRNFGDSDFPRVFPLLELALFTEGDRITGDVFKRLRSGVPDLEVTEVLLPGVVGLQDGDEGRKIGLELVTEGEDDLPLLVLVVLHVELAVPGRRGLKFPR